MEDDYGTREEFEAAMSRLIRRELDRKPDGFEKYQAACVAYFDYNANFERPDWTAKESNRLEDAAIAARPK